MALPGGAPVTLAASPICWQVEQGTVEVYLTWPGGRQLISVAETDDRIFGLSESPPDGASLQLVTAEPASLRESAPSSEAMARLADDWIGSALTNLTSNLPDAVRVLTAEEAEADEPVSVTDGEQLASPRDVWWLAPGPGVVLDLNQSGEMTLAPDMVCLHGPLWLRAKGRGTVRPRSSADLGSTRLPQALAAFTESLIRLFDAQDTASDAAALERMTGHAGTGGRTTDPIRTAFDRIGDQFRVKPSDRPSLPTKAETMPIPALARIAGYRARKITLEEGWHRRDHGPLLIRRDAENAPLEALIWDGRGYTSTNGRVTEAQTFEYQHSAYTVSAALPYTVTGLWSLAFYVMRAGNRQDATYTALAAAGVALIGILTPLGTGWLLSDIVPAGMFGLLTAVGVALSVGALVSTALGIARTFATTRISGRGGTVLGAALTDRLLRLPTRFFKDFSAGDLNQRIENVEQMRQLAVGVVMSSGLTAVLSVVYLGVLLMYDARLAFMGIGLVTVYIVAVVIARVLQMEAIRDAAQLDGEIAGLTHETLEGVGKLRAAAAEERAMERWLDVYRRERAAGVRAGRVGVNFGAFADTYQTITLMTLFAGAGLLSTMDASAGVFIAFLAAFGSFQGAIVGLCQALLEVYTAQPLVERARPILEAKPEVDPGRTDPGILKGAIEGTGLSFAYAEGLPPILNNLSFEVRPGEHMAIVGGSGSGKSTLLRLLLGFESPQRGSILYDGQDLLRLDLTRVRSQIGVVLQASQLFAGSILENIRGASSAPLEDCLAAVEKAGLARDLQTFAMGIHTPITEGAGTLSGGQRQRILIARALAANPNILFFDEATSALDNATQAVVSATLDQLRVTRITIAHRLSTVRNADRICVLENGKFVEQGTFDELMALDGAFAALARRQLTGE
ncbi:MAG: ATP-binding cassette domain-containing protein [Pseudomonadota bacterium]